MTAMVGEFPELQGTMGRYYAEADGRSPEELCRAIEEHYRPRFAGDALPATKTGQAVALADKIDTLVGIFSIDQRPTGAKDPFGLRRAALGALRILIEGGLDLDLTRLLGEAAALQPVARAGVVDEVYDFIAERFRGILLEQAGTTSEMLDAVLAKRPESPLDALTRLTALKAFPCPTPPCWPRSTSASRTSSGSSRSIRPRASTRSVSPRTSSEPVPCGRGNSQGPVEKRGRRPAMLRRVPRCAGRLRAPVDEFFDRVMVMDEDPGRRNNRLALLTDGAAAARARRRPVAASRLGPAAPRS